MSGFDREPYRARGVHHAAAAGAELLAAALPRPLPQEVAALPPAQPRHQGAHHRGRQPAQPQPGRQAAPSLPSHRYNNHLTVVSLYSYFNPDRILLLPYYIYIIFRKIKSDRALICECTDHNLQGYNDFQYFLTNFSALSHHHSTKIAY